MHILQWFQLIAAATKRNMSMTVLVLLREEHKLRVYENRMLRWLFRSKRNGGRVEETA
jgi:hypothetical protein